MNVEERQSADYKVKTYFDNASGNVEVAPGTLKYVSPLYPSNIKIVEGQVTPNPDKRRFMPRLGFVYRPSENFVVRGGYGIFTYRIDYFDRVSGGGPFQIAETYVNAITNGQPLLAFPNPFPTTLATASGIGYLATA